MSPKPAVDVTKSPPTQRTLPTSLLPMLAVLIGLTLGVTGGDSFKTLLVALAFHQVGGMPLLFC